MHEQYHVRLEELMSNYHALRKAFRWDYEAVSHLIVLGYTMRSLPIDIERIQSMKLYIQKNTGVFSAYRGHMQYMLSGMLCAASDNPEAQFDRMLEYEPLFKRNGFKNSMYFPTALMTLTNTCKPEDVETHCAKAAEIYQSMRKNHPFLTSGDDYALAILLAGKSYDLEHLEEYYRSLHDHGFSKSNGLQMMSHIMAFSPMNLHEAVDQCVRIYDRLKDHKLKVYSDYYPAIALMALLGVQQDELIDQLIEMAHFLRKQKGYRALGKGMNILMSASIIAGCRIDNDSIASTAVQVSVEAIIAAQQAAVIAAITASTAAASSAAT